MSRKHQLEGGGNILDERMARHLKAKNRPDVMSVEEIRWWLRELLTRHGWGNNNLSRTLGIDQCRGGHKQNNMARRMMDGRAYIHPRQRVRMSYMLKRIISGELVQQRVRFVNSSFPGWLCKTVVADRPVPLPQPLHWHVDLRRGTAALAPPEPYAPTLPNFRTLLDKAQPYAVRAGFDWAHEALRWQKKAYGEPPKR